MSRAYCSANMSAILRRMSSIDKLLQTPLPELVADLKALRDERAVTERKEAMLEQTLDMIIEQRGEEAANEIAALGGSAGIGSLRNQILQVIALTREKGRPTSLALVPKEVLDTLVERGNRKVTLDNVRVTMKRMFDSGELERPIAGRDLLYALPGTADEFPREIAALAAAMLEQARSR
jgi:SpoVK/Ycf46/Vps4 family AAA+-type ATPase